MPILLSGFIGAIIGAVATFAFNMWKFHRDERNAKCDELCKAIIDAGVIAVEYWSQKYESELEQQKAEARLLAAQSFIDGQYEDFRLYLQVATAEEIDGHLASLIDDLTGGTFSEGSRDFDRDRMQIALRRAHVVVIAIRRAHRASFPFYHLSTAYHQNRHRTLDIPTCI